MAGTGKFQEFVNQLVPLFGSHCKFIAEIKSLRLIYQELKGQ